MTPQPRILRNIACSLAMLSAVVMFSAVSAKADPFTLGNGQTKTVNYLTSFAGSHAVATFTYNQATKQLTVVLTNNSTDNTKLFAFGFDSAGLTQVGNTSIANIVVTDGITFQDGSQSLQHTFGVNSTSGNFNDVLSKGETLTAVFTFTTGPSSITIDISRIHMGALPNGDSEKPTGVVTVPEPASMLLLGTGLLAVAAGVRRRNTRKSK